MQKYESIATALMLLQCFTTFRCHCHSPDQNILSATGSNILLMRLFIANSSRIYSSSY